MDVNVVGPGTIGEGVEQISSATQCCVIPSDLSTTVGGGIGIDGGIRTGPEGCGARDVDCL